MLYGYFLERLQEIAQIGDGWHDGGGVAPCSKKLWHICHLLKDNYPTRLQLPAIFPTQDGNLLLEWDVQGNPSVDIDLQDMSVYFHVFGSERDDVEMDFSLTCEAGIKSFMGFLQAHIPVMSS